MGGSTHKTSQKYDGVIVQSSLKGVAVTKGWGTTKTGCNLIDYLDFSSKKVSSGGKGGGAQQNYDYYATLLLAIGLGPIAGVRTIYKDSAYYIAQGAGSKEVNGTQITISAKTPVQAAGLSQLFLGSIFQSPWTYLSSAHPANALGYSGLAYAAAENYNLNSSATVPNFNFEVQWPVRATISGAVQDDANPADILDDLLPGIPRWPTGVIASLSSLQTYCYAQGLLLSPQASGGRQASDLVTEILTCANADCFVSEGLFQAVPLGDTYAVANGATYTPNLTPIYSLTYDDVLPNSAGEDPIQWDIKPADQCHNYLTVGFLDRSQQYANDNVPAQDSAALAAFGRNQADPVTYESICSLGVASVVAQLLVQKAANLRRTAKLLVPETFGLLDPLDLIEVPAPNGAATLVRINATNEQDDGSIELDVEEMLVGTAHAPLYTRQNGLGVPSNFAVDPGDSVAPSIINPPMSLTGGQNEVWLATAGAGPEWGGANVWVSLDGEEFYQQGTVSQAGRFGVTSNDFPSASDPDQSDTLNVDLTASGGALTAATQAAADAQTTLCAVGTEIIAYSAATLTAPSKYALGTYIRRGLEGTSIADQPSGSLFMRLDDAVIAIPYNAGQIGKTMYVKLQSFNAYGNGFQDLDLCETYTFTAEPNGSQVVDVSWSTLSGIPALVTSYVASGGTAVNTQAVGTMSAAAINTALSNLNPLQDTSTPNTPPQPTVTFTTALDATGSPIVTLKGTVATATDANIAGYEFQLTINGGAPSTFPTTLTSFTWQVPPGVSYSLQVREVKLSGVRGNFSTAATGTTAVNASAPAAPSGLAALGGYGANFLSWTNPPNSDLDHCAIYASATNNSAAAVQVGTVSAAPGGVSSYVQTGLTVLSGSYYWVAAFNTSGVASALAGPAFAQPVAIPGSALATSGDNLCRDPLFNDPAGIWQGSTIYNEANNTTVGGSTLTSASDWYVNGQGDNQDLQAAGGVTLYSGKSTPYGYNQIRYSLYCHWSGASSDLKTACSPLVGGATYEIGAQLENRSNQTIYVQIDALDPGGNYLGTFAVAAGPSAGPGFFTNQFTAPANAAWGRWAVLNSAENTLSGYMRAGALSLRKAATTTGYSPGSVTGGVIAASTIVGANVAAGTLTALHIQAQSLTTNLFAANSISASILQVGSMNANVIQAGTITATQISASAGITANQLSVGQLSAITANLGVITAGYLQNAAGSTFFDLTNARQQFGIGSYALRMGAIGSGVLLWYGPNSVSLGSETTANCIWAFGTDGQIYRSGSSLPSQSPGGLSTTQVSTAPSSGQSPVTVTFAAARVAGTVQLSAFLAPNGGGNTISPGTSTAGGWAIYALDPSGNTTLLQSGSWQASYTSGDPVVWTINGQPTPMMVTVACPANTVSIQWQWNTAGSGQVATAKVNLSAVYTPAG